MVMELLTSNDAEIKCCSTSLYSGDVTCDSVWILEPWHHIEGISIMRCIKYDVTEDPAVKSTACHWCCLILGLELSGPSNES